REPFDAGPAERDLGARTREVARPEAPTRRPTPLDGSPGHLQVGVRDQLAAGAERVNHDLRIGRARTRATEHPDRDRVRTGPQLVEGPPNPEVGPRRVRIERAAPNAVDRDRHLAP